MDRYYYYNFWINDWSEKEPKATSEIYDYVYVIKDYNTTLIKRLKFWLRNITKAYKSNKSKSPHKLMQLMHTSIGTKIVTLLFKAYLSEYKV